MVKNVMKLNENPELVDCESVQLEINIIHSWTELYIANLSFRVNTVVTAVTATNI